MGAFINQHILDQVKAQNPELRIRSLTAQQERCLYFYLKGHTMSSAAKAAGTNLSVVRRLLESDTGRAVVQYFNDQMVGDIVVDRNLLTTLLFEAHAKAATVTEEIMAINALARLHDVFLDTQENRKKAPVQINQINTVTSQKQLAKLETNQLLELVSDDLKHLFTDFSMEKEKEIAEDAIFEPAS